MSDAKDFIRNQCVYSKLISSPTVGRCGDLTLVFLRGYPMTIRGFYSLFSRAVFGPSLYMRKSQWTVLNSETVVLCRGLNLNLTAGQEGLSLVEALRTGLGWNETLASSGQFYTEMPEIMAEWIRIVDEGLARTTHPSAIPEIS